jgi:tetratricopeptide (TPR) repeat protein
MRRGPWILGSALTLWAVTALPLRAGVYNAEESDWPLPVPFQKVTSLPGLPVTIGPSPFQNTLRNLLNAANERAPKIAGEESARERYLRRAGELEAALQGGTAGAEDRVNLGAYYIRLGKYEEAVRVLAPAAQDRKNFRALANFATAHFLAGRPDRAIEYQKQALDAWPDVVAGWSDQELAWYRRAEKYYLTLLQARYQESIRPTRKGGLDPIFPGVRFVGRSGEHEAGEIAPAQWAELPPDAIGLVEQLVLWLPLDNDLYWQLGEVLNAWGHVFEAKAALDDLIYTRRFDNPEARRHWLVLRQASDLKLTLMKLGSANDELLLGVTRMRGGDLAPGVGGLAAESAWVAAYHAAARRDRGDLSLTPSAGGESANPSPGTADLPKAPWVPEWRQIVVSFAAGAVVALLVAQQVRQGRRRWATDGTRTKHG